MNGGARHVFCSETKANGCQKSVPDVAKGLRHRHVTTSLLNPLSPSAYTLVPRGSRLRSENAMSTSSGVTGQGRGERLTTPRGNKRRRACHAAVDRAKGNIKLHRPGKRRGLDTLTPARTNALNPNRNDPSPPEVLVGSIVPMLSMQCIAGSTHVKELRAQLAARMDQESSQRELWQRAEKHK